MKLTDQHSPTNSLPVLAVVGGTGKEGSGLAFRWANSGYTVYIGSRDAERAQAKADELNALLGSQNLHGAANLDAVNQADIVILSVPYDAHQRTIEGIREALEGKLVIDVTVPLLPPNVRQVHIPESKAAVLETHALLGDGVNLVAAFQNISAVHLMNLEHEVDCDVLVCGDNADAKNSTIELVKAAGMRGIDAGTLANAVAVEALTPVLLYINKRYKAKGAGIRITGVSVE